LNIRNHVQLNIKNRP